MKRSPASLTAAIAVAAVSLSAFAACSEGSSDEDGAAGGGSTAVGRGGSGGKASRGGSGGGDTSGGAPAGEAGDGSGATGAGAPSSGKGGSGSGTGGDPTGGGVPGAGGAFHVPGPAPGGGSVYAVECSGETAMCGTEYAHCLGLNLPDSQVGFACSNHCETVADCSDEPTGAEAQPGCVQFTMEKRCMLMCQQGAEVYACPDGMSCYVYPNATFGYCLWM